MAAPRLYHAGLSNAAHLLAASRQRQLEGYASHSPLVMKPLEAALGLMEKACTGNTAQYLHGLWEANPLASSPQDLDEWRLEETFLCRLENLETTRQNLRTAEALFQEISDERKKLREPPERLALARSIWKNGDPDQAIYGFRGNSSSI